MSPLPELNLSLGMNIKNSSSNDEQENENVVVRTDSGLRKHTISIIISDQEVGKVHLKINNRQVEISTYKLTVTDDKTNETEIFEVTRDSLSFIKSSTKKSFFSFLGIKRFDKTSFLYGNIAYEPLLQNLEKFDISRHRKLNNDQLIYQFSGNGQNIMLYSGNINDFEKQEDIFQYFIIVDKNDGKSFIGNILYKEKFLKLTPKVELQIVRRKKVPKNMEYDDNGHIKRVIYI
jgi:hypothetical protein